MDILIFATIFAILAALGVINYYATISNATELLKSVKRSFQQ